MSFSLKLFGGASIDAPSGPLTGRAVQRHRLALLALLAASSTRGMSRDRLIAFLWPEADSAKGRHLLSDSVYRINQAVGADAVSAAGDELRLDPRHLPSDVAGFADAIAGREWERAVAAYAGPFLDGFFLSDSPGFENWLDGERARFEREYSRALEALAEEAEAAGSRAHAVRWWRMLAAHDVYNSRVALRLMQALDAVGERAAALQHARTFTLLLREEFDADPDPDVVELADRLRAAAPAVDPPSAHAATLSTVDDVRTTGRDSPVGPTTRTGEEIPGHLVVEVNPAAGVDDRHARVPPSRRRHARLILLPGLAAVLIMLVALGIVWRRPVPAPSAPALSSAMAVLPFADLSPNGDQEYFSDGITEELINRLAQVEGLRVVARTSAFAFKGRQIDVRDVGTQLNVATVLEGSVRKAGNRVRITAQLVNVADGYHIWSQTYERDMEDVFAIQEEISNAIVATLTGTLAGAVESDAIAAPAVAPEAYDLYLKGRHSLYLKGRYAWYRRTEEGMRTALSYFEQATAIAPDYARAHAGLADAYAVLGFYDYIPPHEAFPKAEAAAARALELDPALAGPHSTLGYVALYYHWDWPRAEHSFQQSITMDSTYSTAHQWYANFLTARERFAEAEREMRRAQELDPLSLIANAALGWVLFYAGEYERAVEQCRQTLELDADYAVALLWSGWALEELNRFGEAIDVHRRAVALTSSSTLFVAALARAHARAGERDRAVALLREIETRGRTTGYVPSYEIAKIHEALGDRDRAIESLEEAFRQRSHSMVFLKVDPQLRGLRSDPRFDHLVERVGLD
jgi:TolB-like protein/DNA-binding SARP family transcriptional activator/Tfp pilus assembly protein PilF